MSKPYFIQVLRQPEIEHLLDVKTIINAFYWLGSFFGLVQFFVVLKQKKLPDFKEMIGIVFFISVVITGLLSILGSNTVFNFLHEIIFPKENSWFFFYQESLMTTLMKAPDIFGVIAVILLILSGAIFVIINIALNRLITHRGKPK